MYEHNILCVHNKLDVETFDIFSAYIFPGDYNKIKLIQVLSMNIHPLQSVISQPNLYDQDFCLWIENTIKQIEAQEFDKIDWDNVIEELDSLGKSDKRELKNRLVVLLEHLLKLAYWETEREYNQRNWKGTIREQRRQLLLLLEDSPSLKPLFYDSLPKCYSDARKIVLDKTNLSDNIIPIEITFPVEDILNDDYLP